MAAASGGGPILHVVVVGFHHKKGCQVEYSYPPLIAGNPVDSHELPHEWKHLPSLALPDGAHNFTKDTTFFHLEARDGSNSTVYGVSCYRQMDSKDLINRTADVTRSSVQKSVCVLSKLPLYGAIQTKLEMITHAYFDERDFSQVSLLHQTYTNLVSSFPADDIDPTLILHGLKPRDMVLTFRHKILVLFKLLLLERRVLIYGSPVYQCSNVLLSLLSLFPEMVERGLARSAMYSRHDKISPTMDNLSSGDESDFIEVHFHESGTESGHMTRDTSCDIVVLSESENVACDSDLTSEGGVITDQGNGKFIEAKSCDGEIYDEKFDVISDIKSDINVDYNICDMGKLDNDSVDNKNRNISSIICEKSDVHYTQYPQKISTNESNNIKIDVNTKLPNDNSPQKTSPIISYDDRNDPLADITGITNAENIQSAATLHYSTDDAITMQTSSLSARSTVHTVRIPSLEEVKQIGCELIDSPESIDKIDQEDCFSWEDDSLMLEIDQELGIDSPNRHNNKNTSISSAFEVLDITRPSEQTITHDIEPPTHTSIAQSESTDHDITILKPVDNIESVVDRLNYETKTLDTIDGKTIRNRLVSAFSNRSKTKPDSDISRVKHLSNIDEEAARVLKPDCYGFPLAIFTKGSLCHPYLCLQYYDLLHDVNVRSFLIAASNILFTQKQNLVDVVVDIHEPKIDVNDPELRRQLTLSTADLRFADHLVKTVANTTNNEYLNGTEWEGGNEWLRAQFRLYLQSLLSASINPDGRYLEDYNPTFVSAWSMSRNYRVWQKLDHTEYQDISPSHPCHGNLSVTDLKVKWTSTMQGSDRGRKINSAVSQTGKYVVQTGKYVGGALTSAKSAVSSWFSGLSSNSSE